MSKTMFALIASVSLLACGKKAEKKEPAPAKPAATAPAGSAAAPAGGAAASGGSTPEPIICCEFNGVKGTSTKSLCEQGKGTVVSNDQCPMIK